ncbi:MAG TPA: hypothetical protein VFB72_06005 [Verrucomicrobiae bacterium]|nr:hypothetical protein [Verrucomicrobiae bacterium]
MDLAVLLGYYVSVMIPAMEQAKTSSFKGAPHKISQYVGEVVYIYAFDVAYDMARQPIRELMGQPVAQFAVDASKRSPRHLFFYKPQMVRLPPLERIGPRGPVRIERTVKILPVGAISITVSVPFVVPRVEDLVDYHDLQFTNGTLQDEVRQLAEEIRRELHPFLIRPVPELFQEEAYTVFCIQSPLTTDDDAPLTAEDWLHAHRREVASLLTQEPDIDHLSNQEADESTGRFLSYYEHDLVVVDWDAAMIIDHREQFHEPLYVMELANVQLAELEAYDRILDESLERSYRDLSVRRSRSRGDILRELRDIRIDLTRFNDELSNITKFFGDWHLARIYENVAARFHLADWHRSIEGKLKTLDDLYQLLKHDQNNRWMLILEVTIVLLFVIDVILLLLGLKH